MPRIIIQKYDDDANWYHLYTGQPGPQPVRLYLACGSGRVEIDYDTGFCGSDACDEHEHHTLTWLLDPYISGRQANELIAEIRPLLKRVVGGYSVKWDGTYVVGVHTDDANDAYEQIQVACSRYDGQGSAVIDNDEEV